MKINKYFAALPVLYLVAGGVLTAAEQTTASDAVVEGELSIMELMVSNVTPATDTLWGIDDPQTDEEWQVFVDAANATIAAFEQAKKGGAGPNDDAWATDPKWQAYADAVIAAAMSAKRAIAARDMDAMFEAGDALYTPCEACHIDFNVAVQAE
jgi:cytochrome c556